MLGEKNRMAFQAEIQRSCLGLHQFKFKKVIHAHTCGLEMPVDCASTISYFNFLY